METSADKVGRLIDSIMAKDEEIRDLRREISMLRDQLDATNISCLTDGQSHMFSRLAPVVTIFAQPRILIGHLIQTLASDWLMSSCHQLMS